LNKILGFSSILCFPWPRYFII